MIGIQFSILNKRKNRDEIRRLRVNIEQCVKMMKIQYTTINVFIKSFEQYKKIISFITRKYFFYVDISHLKDVSYLDCIKELFCMIKMKQEGLA